VVHHNKPTTFCVKVALNTTISHIDAIWDWWPQHPVKNCIWNLSCTTYNVKGKGKVVLVLSHEGIWGSGCIDRHFLDLGTTWRWEVSFMPLPLYSQYPFDRRLHGPQSQSGLHGENSWPYWDSNSYPSVVQPAASRYTDYAILAPTTYNVNIRMWASSELVHNNFGVYELSVCMYL
jgi:hypothetical protein